MHCTASHGLSDFMNQVEGNVEDTEKETKSKGAMEMQRWEAEREKMDQISSLLDG